MHCYCLYTVCIIFFLIFEIVVTAGRNRNDDIIINESEISRNFGKNEPETHANDTTNDLTSALFVRNEVQLRSLLNSKSGLNTLVGPNARNMLQVAILNGDTAKIYILLGSNSAAININHKDCNGETALMMAVGVPPLFHPLTVVLLLLAHGADPNARNNRGQTALHRCVTHFCSGANSNTDFFGAMMRTLLDAGARVDAEDDRGQLPLDLPQVS